nr:LTA synthase family protein [Sphingopyxis panaciterrae]
MFVGAVLLDRLVRPRPMRRGWRSRAGLALLIVQVAALFGLFLGICGSVPVAAALVFAVLAVLLVASNSKYAMLGEPLLFSDLALFGAIFRHPQFYLSAVRTWQLVAMGLAAAALVAAIGRLFVAAPEPHLAGALLLLGSLALLFLGMRSGAMRSLAVVPDADADVARYGLLPTLLLYWLRWRESGDPPPLAPIARQAPQDPAELLIVVQCESFADPVELFADPGLSLPGLAAARGRAWQWGNLDVSGFGAYTMRTEYGVLFGRDEAALGFRRYDPFLTAPGEASHALPARLDSAGWRSLFLHPHDMRFYGRDRIMSAGGFAELIGEDRFLSPAPGEGRYVTDAAVARLLLDLAARTREPGFLYAVTIENHGPWAAEGKRERVDRYLRLVRNSDAMLTALADGIAALRRPARLVFFGDHRPSIPGASAPGGARHTPYVMIRFDGSGGMVPGPNRRVDLTPAELHHAILDDVLGAPVAR